MSLFLILEVISLLIAIAFVFLYIFGFVTIAASGCMEILLICLLMLYEILILFFSHFYIIICRINCVKYCCYCSPGNYNVLKK